MVTQNSESMNRFLSFRGVLYTVISCALMLLSACGGETDTLLEDPSVLVETEPETATIRGTITASAEPSHGGIGTLYVAATDRSPFMGTAEQIGGIVISDVSFSAQGEQVEYELVVPIGAKAYVTALFDDNGNASDSNPPGPDRGDLLSLEGLDPPSVMVTEPGEYVLNLDLNFHFPF